MTQINFPYRVDGRGRTTQTSMEDHIRDLIELVLFTSPGERVNRPTFGSGLMQLVFAPGSGELAIAVQAMVQGALQQWLGDLIVVENVEAEHQDATLRVSVRYVIRQSQQRHTAEFSREV